MTNFTCIEKALKYNLETLKNRFKIAFYIVALIFVIFLLIVFGFFNYIFDFFT